MRKIDKDYLNPPATLVSVSCNASIVLDCNTRTYHGSRYKSNDVKLALESLYLNKCGYCEEFIIGVARENIEHYRPKGGVEPIDLNPGTYHDGYYWLGNEWSNLLIACPRCNDQGNKGNRFPLSNAAKRVKDHRRFLASGSYWIKANHFSSSHMKSEDPLILNPEMKDPDKHLHVINTGELKPLRKSKYGTKTIEICDLNRKGSLVQRKKIIDDVVTAITQNIVRHTSGQEPLTPGQFKVAMFDVFDEITKKTLPDAEFTMVSRCILRNFEQIILQDLRIPVVFRSIIRVQFFDYIGI
jgi:hypothetical protein